MNKRMGQNMWDKAKLSGLAKERKEALADVEAALLAFARTQEMTDEPEMDPQQARKELEDALDKLEPEAGDRLRKLGSAQRDELLRDFLLEMTDHNQKRIERDIEEVRALSRGPEKAPVDDEDDEGTTRKRGPRR